MLGDPLGILVQGIALGFGLCCTVGPQSIFVLRQGMRGEAALRTATICSLGDLGMILAGAAGFGLVLTSFPALASAANGAGAVFVMLYGVKMLLEGWRRESGAVCNRGAACATMTALALTLLNPQVYLEMVGLVGSIAIRFPAADRVIFAVGVMLVSPVWFYSLALGGQRLSALFGHRRALRVIDLATGAAMLGIGTAMAVAGVIPAAP